MVILYMLNIKHNYLKIGKYLVNYLYKIFIYFIILLNLLNLIKYNLDQEELKNELSNNNLDKFNGNQYINLIQY